METGFTFFSRVFISILFLIIMLINIQQLPNEFFIVIEIKNSINFLEKGLSTFEARYAARVIRSSMQFRHRLIPAALRTAALTYISPTDSVRKDILDILDDIVSFKPEISYKLHLTMKKYMNTSDTPVNDAPTENTHQSYYLETEAYIGLLVLLYLYDQKAIEHVCNVSFFHIYLPNIYLFSH